MSEVLRIENLSICFDDSEKATISKVNLKIAPCETLGLVGESGSGKSLTALSILNILPRNAKKLHGEIYINGKIVDQHSKNRTDVAVILQDQQRA